MNSNSDWGGAISMQSANAGDHIPICATEASVQTDWEQSDQLSTPSISWSIREFKGHVPPHSSGRQRRVRILRCDPRQVDLQYWAPVQPMAVATDGFNYLAHIRDRFPGSLEMIGSTSKAGRSKFGRIRGND